MIWLFVVLLGHLLSGCQPRDPPQPFALAGYQMTMKYHILIGHPITQKDLPLIQTIIDDTFSEVDLHYNKWNPKSEVSVLNQLKAGEKVELSPQLHHLLVLTEKVHFLTLGKFDPTIEPLQQIWKKSLILGREPKSDETQKVHSAIGWKNIHFDQGIFWKDHDQTALDLGGIAKGFCVDLLTERLKQLGYANIFVEWGGEIRAEGQHPSGRSWNIYISRLEDSSPDHAIEVVSLNNAAIATSGDYLQYWQIQTGSAQPLKTYYHVFDAVKKEPLLQSHTNVASASVVAKSCLLADGLATAALMFDSLEEAEKWAQELMRQDPTLKFWLVSRKSLHQESNSRAQ